MMFAFPAVVLLIAGLLVNGGSQRGPAAGSLTVSEMDALRTQMQRCWMPPAGANAQALVVTVQVRLSIDGSVVSIEQVGAQSSHPLSEVAADAAQRAVLDCQPYRLPREKYDSWRDIQVIFDPRDPS